MGMPWAKRAKVTADLRRAVEGVTVEESLVVVVVDERAQHSYIHEVLAFPVQSVSNLVHALSVIEHILESEVERIVDEGVEGVALVGSQPADVAVEHLADLENAGCLGVLGPELDLHIGNGVHANSVKAKCFYLSGDPVFEELPDEGVVLVQVG
eukprot:CAMPEP_0202956956 /NCGR_PEP_ID=MMETSP1396-20130829/1405_1 /ASSEMBLY_ACC=CAM_ASM_000872 /TAXON_ID= /ORGANISM="Pseudokeronopsis sp., Strain Brazil" /LENGTH=153 /DNA_ID=CAMNT_0049674197 /DNA_START=450 /DNA_END=910 /DNA_ORIENTATION=+